jgi:hypothetical protein
MVASHGTECKERPGLHRASNSSRKAVAAPSREHHILGVSVTRHQHIDGMGLAHNLTRASLPASRTTVFPMPAR